MSGARGSPRCGQVWALVLTLLLASRPATTKLLQPKKGLESSKYITAMQYFSGHNTDVLKNNYTVQSTYLLLLQLFSCSHGYKVHLYKRKDQ